MLNFLKKKKFNNNNVKEFNSACKAVEFFIMLKEWEKAKKAVKEIELKEKQSLSIVLEKLDNLDDKDWINQKEKILLTNELKRKIRKLNILLDIIEKKEEKHKQSLNNKRFKIRFNAIKKEIESLKWNKKNEQAIILLKKFLEENGEKQLIIKFYNRERKNIIKRIEKESKEKNKKIKANVKLEAMNLIWETIKNENKSENNKNEKWFFKKLKDNINFLKKMKERNKKRKLLEEISLLIEEDSKIKNDLAAKKLENIHRWLIKELSNKKIIWYDIYWKILWADKISWDTFWFVENEDKYNFFLWDATWHWIRAWFIVTLFSRLFNKYVKKSNLKELMYEINNWLKQDLKSRNFITWILFDIYKENNENINFVWMWHEPMIIFRKNKQIIEKVIPWWLAAWIRLIKKVSDIKIKKIKLEDWDILLTYSDWVIESKKSNWEFYSIDKLSRSFLNSCQAQIDIHIIYENIINDLKNFRWWSNFDDDVSILLLKRETKKDLVDITSDYLQDIKNKEWLRNYELKKLQWKSIEEINKELEEIKKKKETQRIIKNLETLYYTWEILKLKQESIRYIKEWFIDKKINFFLKKAIENEKSYKIEQKNQKIANKFNVLDELLKKGDYNTVIDEVEEIISKDWSI